MRNPERIERIAAKLARVWTFVPDWRLGQLVVNTVDRADPFHVEDEDLERALDKALTLHAAGGPGKEIAP